MKLCIVTSTFPPEIGGPATYTYEVASRLKGKHQILVVTLTRNPRRIDGMDIFTAAPGFFGGNQPLPRILRFLVTYLNMFLYLIKNYRKYDLIYIQSPDYIGLMSTLFAKALRKPIVLKFVGDVAWENASREKETSKSLKEFLKYPEGGTYTRLMLRIQRFVFRRVKKIVTPSQYLKDILTAYYKVSPGRIRVIPNAAELVDFKASASKTKYRTPTICTIGRLILWKRIDKIITIMPDLIQRYPELTFLIIGDGPERQNLQELVRKLGVKKHVTFLGKIEHEKAMNILKSSDVFILNSAQEGLPHVILEAMACQVPVIATNIGGTDEVIDNNRTGLLIEPDNGQELEEKIALVLGDKRLRSRLVRNAYKDIERKFAWERNLILLEKELKAVL